MEAICVQPSYHYANKNKPGNSCAIVVWPSTLLGLGVHSKGALDLVATIKIAISNAREVFIEQGKQFTTYMAWAAPPLWLSLARWPLSKICWAVPFWSSSWMPL